MAVLTLLDIAKMNGSDAVVGLIEEATREHPEISGRLLGRQLPNVGAARTIKGTQYKTLVRTAVPVAGFRGANEGTAPVKSTFENRLVETFILNPRWECDKAVADANEDGPEAVIALEGVGMLEGAMTALGKQFYYGRATPGHAKGHPGLIDAVQAAMVVDAGGTTAATASSAWLVKFGPKNVQWVWGEEGDLALSDVRIESLTDPADSTKKFTGYVQEILAYPGVQVGSIHSLARIKKLTEDAGKGLTDKLIYQALSLFPSGWVPDVILCTRRSLRQLRDSRTATNATGAPAPNPTDVEGIPIATTDALLDTEALTL